jgi:ElaB/YqjD/DUF883 family membrane-anchored ribosome-binding protein
MMTATHNPSAQEPDSMAFKDTEGTSPTTAKMASAAHNAVDVAARNFEQAEKALREARAAAGYKASETAQQAQSWSEDLLANTKAYVELYPMRSLGIAVASGYLLSVLLKK